MKNDPKSAMSDHGSPADDDLARLIETRLLGVRPDSQDLQLEDHDWERIIAALSRPVAGAEPEIEERKFYRSHWTATQLLAARDGGLQADPGEAWRYRYTHRDAQGEYDLLYRPVRKIAGTVKPVAFLYQTDSEEWLSKRDDDAPKADCDFKVIPLYTSQPTPAAIPAPVALPQAGEVHLHSETDHWPTCEACARSIMPGHFVHTYPEGTEVHVDCDKPYATPSDPSAMFLIGDPMRLIPAVRCANIDRAGNEIAARLCDWSKDGERPMPLMQEAARFIRSLIHPSYSSSPTPTETPTAAAPDDGLMGRYREAIRILEIFRRHYDLNDCEGRTGNIEIPVSALRAAASFLAALSTATGDEGGKA